MTREEAIKKAANKHASVVDEAYRYAYQDGFLAGVKWADNHPINVWHDASEEPKEDMDILCISKNGKVHKVSEIYHQLYNYLKDDGIKKWAYISDLLPKGSER